MNVEFDKLPDKFYFIPGNVPSSKNSKQWTGKILIWGKTAREYRDRTAWDWKLAMRRFATDVRGNKKPLVIGFYFVRDSKRKFDFTGPLETCQDLMVTYEGIHDDNITEIIPVPVKIAGQWYHVDKDKPGVYIIPLL